MAFITNQSANGSAKLGDRLKELVGHADQLDMLVGALKDVVGGNHPERLLNGGKHT